MKEQLEKRLEQLKAEFEAGQKKLGELEVKTNNLRNTILRISGAIQVLEEELTRVDQTDSAGSEGSDDTVVAMPSSSEVSTPMLHKHGKE